MRKGAAWLAMVAGGCLMGATMIAAQQSTTKTTEVRRFEVVSVDGNKVVVRGPQGTRELTVPDDFRLDVDGQPVSVRDLKPGMKGTATITTTTTSTPVTVTEVRNAEVVQVSGNSILVRGQNGFRNFTEGEAAERGVKIYRDGQPVRLTELRRGDHLTATIVTEKPPTVMTQRQVQASLTGAPPPPATAAPAGTTGTAAAAPPSPAPAAPAAPPAAAPSAPARTTLPTTASTLPLAGLIALASIAGGLILSVRRRLGRSA